MCLETPAFFAKRRIAKKDMTVWKFMLQHEDSKKLFAYFRYGYEYEVGKEYSGILDFPKKWDGFFKKGSVRKGFHSLASFRDALNASRKDKLDSTVVVRCTIPKGSEYYVGNWEVYKGYASNIIRIDEIVPYEIISHTKRVNSGTGGSSWAI